jgi:hypothetical protein
MLCCSIVDIEWRGMYVTLMKQWEAYVCGRSRFSGSEWVSSWFPQLFLCCLMSLLDGESDVFGISANCRVLHQFHTLFCIMCVFFVIFLTNRENEFSGFGNQKDSRDQQKPGEWKFEGVGSWSHCECTTWCLREGFNVYASYICCLSKNILTLGGYLN